MASATVSSGEMNPASRTTTPGNVSSEENVVPNEPSAEGESARSHPLQFSWTLRHDQPSKHKSWGTDMHEVATFRTVEEFWALFNNLLEPSRLPVQHTYSLFKTGIKPEWEDSALTDGGEWRVQIPPVQKDTLDQSWVNTLLTLIGDNFAPDESDDIAGIFVNVRKGSNRISLWTRSSQNEDLQMSIGTQWRQEALQASSQPEYFSFETLRKNSRKRVLYSL